MKKISRVIGIHKGTSTHYHRKKLKITIINTDAEIFKQNDQWKS